MDPLSDREFRFTTEQYVLYAQRVTELQKEREVWIRHGQQVYRLRRTSSGKLYLSK